jgi:hypothetical protein
VNACKFFFLLGQMWLMIWWIKPGVGPFMAGCIFLFISIISAHLLEEKK